MLLVLLGALFGRGNASGFHFHVESCQKTAQELCCDHHDVTLSTHCETPALPEHGHCHHVCCEDVSDTMGTVGALGDMTVKPILRAIGFAPLPGVFDLKQRTLEKFGNKITGPPPQVHLVRDTVRLL